MDEDRNGAPKRRYSGEFKKKGMSKRGKWSNLNQDYHENPQVPNPSDTVYRILCPSKRIGSVIGKGGGIINTLREDTGATISVSDKIRSDDRVITIYSPAENDSKKDTDEGIMEEFMLPHCPAQDALMKVHDRIIVDELSTEIKDDEQHETVVTARLLVPHNMVGCVLGKGGDVIKKLRNETGANIRILSADHLPSCALRTDELVQIQGNPMVLKKALYEVSTLLHLNPRKEKALNFGMPLHGSGFRPAGPPMSNMPPSRNPMWAPRNPSPHMPPPPWMHDYVNCAGFAPGGFGDDLIRPDSEASGEFSLKILCLVSKIGGVIGKGGSNVRQLQQETGTSIHVEDAPSSSEERVIRVSAFETLQNLRSQTIDAILVLQNKVSEVSEKGVITTRLLLPSNKVGCLIGQGGAIINEMRRRSQADIRVHSKDEKPECALEDEELVQVSGSFAVAKDALAEIASRLRVRCLKDSSAAAEPPPPRSVQGYGPGGSFSQVGHPVPGPLGVDTPGGNNVIKGALHDYGPHSHPPHPSASRYPNSSSVEVHFPNNAVSSVPGAGGFYATTPEAPGTTRVNPQDPYSGRSESMADIHGGSDHFNAAPSLPHNYTGQSNPHQGSYLNPNGQGSYPSIAPQQVPYQSSYQNPQIPYQQNSSQQTPYQNMNAQYNTAYQSVTSHGAYQY